MAPNEKLDDKQRQAFVNEAAILFSCRHPHVVRTAWQTSAETQVHTLANATTELCLYNTSKFSAHYPTAAMQVLFLGAFLGEVRSLADLPAACYSAPGPMLLTTPLLTCRARRRCSSCRWDGVLASIAKLEATSSAGAAMRCTGGSLTQDTHTGAACWGSVACAVRPQAAAAAALGASGPADCA